MLFTGLSFGLLLSADGINAQTIRPAATGIEPLTAVGLTADFTDGGSGTPEVEMMPSLLGKSAAEREPGNKIRSLPSSCQEIAWPCLVNMKSASNWPAAG